MDVVCGAGSRQAMLSTAISLKENGPDVADQGALSTAAAEPIDIRFSSLPKMQRINIQEPRQLAIEIHHPNLLRSSWSRTL